MAMMGHAASSEASLYDLLDLVKDEAKFQQRVRDLIKHKDAAETTLRAAAENNRKAEENRQSAIAMLNEANQQANYATRLKADADAATKKAADDQRAIEARAAELHKEHETRKMHLRGDLEAAYAGRESAIQQREHELTAQIQEFEAQKAAFDTERSEFLAKYRQDTDKLQMEREKVGVITRRLEAAQAAAAENEKKIKEKLSKIQEIATE